MKKLALILVSICFFGCANQTVSPNTPIQCGSSAISFASEVKPIIDATCATTSSCHATSSTRGPGAPTTYSQIYTYRSSISSSVSSGRMPEGSTLFSEQKSKIVCWIQNGAANN